MAHDSNITRFYTGTNILVTGGAGFFGKMLIQKLLRTYEDIECIYLIVRSKKEKLPQDRMREVFHNPIFDLLRQEKPNFERKICILEGDASLLKFGLGEIDRCMLIDKVDVVFHCAAYLSMTAELKVPVQTNVRGTCELLDLCKEMKKLKSFVMVSTAYSNTSQRVIEEKFYESNIGFETVIRLVEEMDDSTIKKITPAIITSHPNTYAFSKNVAEKALLIKGEKMPVSLFRPSIVGPAYSDPLKGWTDNVYGPTGVGMLYGLGIGRVFLINTKLKTDFVPVDYCVNALICSAWDSENRRLEKPSDIPVYNYSAGEKYSRSWSTMIETGSSLAKYQSKRVIWKRVFIGTKCKYNFYILHYLLHVLPAIFMDIILFVLRKEISMRKVYKKILKFLEVLSFFMLNEWDIKNDNVYAMWKRLTEEERALHPFNMGSMNYEKFVSRVELGAKLYILKEGEEDDTAAHRRYRWLVVAHYTLIALFSLFWIWIAYKLIS